MKMDLLIRNAALLDLETGVEMCSDVGIQRGRIVFVQPAGTAQSDARKELDAAGSYLFPGLTMRMFTCFSTGVVLEWTQTVC